MFDATTLVGRLRSILLAGGLALVAAGGPAATAQQAGQHAGLFLGFSVMGSAPQSAIGFMDSSNRLTTLVTAPAGPWPLWGSVWGATMDRENDFVLVHGFTGAPTQYHVVRIDPRTNTAVGTLWSGPFAQGVPQNLTNLTIDQDGRLVSYDSLLGQFVTYDPVKNLWVGTRVPAWVNAGLGGFLWDKTEGGYQLANAQSANGQILMRADPKFRLTTLAMTTGVRAGYGGDVLQNGDWILSAEQAGPRYYTYAGGQWRAGPLVGTRFWDVTAEKFAAPGRGYFAGDIPNPQSVVYVDAKTGGVTTLLSSTTAPMPGGAWLLEVLPLYRRDLGSQRQGPAIWDLVVNPGGGRFAGKPFIVAAGFTDTRPATRLPDGREIFLRPDTLAIATSTGPLPPYFTGNAGVLDAPGKARVRVNLTQFGKSLNGLRLHFCGVVIDPAAPSGIAWVLDPWTIVVDVP